MMTAPAYSEDQRDCLQEICNVAMGQAAAELADQYQAFITLSIPRIGMLERDNIAEILSDYREDDHIYAATQLFASTQPDSELAGLGMVVLADDSLRDLRTLASKPCSDEELITETCRVLAQSCLDALSEQWELDFQCQPPRLLAADTVRGVCKSLAADWQQVLVVTINYRMEGRAFSGDLLLLFPNRAIAAMAQRLDALLA